MLEAPEQARVKQRIVSHATSLMDLVALGPRPKKLGNRQEEEAQLSS